MENRYEIHYDEIIPGTSCTYRSNGCTIIPLRIIRIRAYTRTTYDRPYATLTRHGGHMLGRASNTTTSDAIDTYPSKSPLHARERLQQLSVSPSLIPPSIPAISSGRGEWWIHFHSFSYPSQLRNLPIPYLINPASPPPFVPVYSIFRRIPHHIDFFHPWNPPTNPFFESLPSLTSGLEN